jgi:hypothetical protein
MVRGVCFIGALLPNTISRSADALLSSASVKPLRCADSTVLDGGYVATSLVGSERLGDGRRGPTLLFLPGRQFVQFARF